MIPPIVLLVAVSLVAAVTWLTVFRPSVDEVALVGLCILCAVLSVL